MSNSQTQQNPTNFSLISLFKKHLKTVVFIGTSVAIIISSLVIYSFWSTDEDQSAVQIGTGAKVQSNVNETANPAYEESIKVADAKVFEDAEITGETTFANTSGDFDNQEPIFDNQFLPIGNGPTEGFGPSIGNGPAIDDTFTAPLLPDTPTEPDEITPTGAASASGAAPARGAAPEINNNERKELMLVAIAALVKKAQPKGATFTTVAITRKQDESLKDGENPRNSNPNVGRTLFIKSGTVYYGEILTTVNSDLISPVIAQIMSGPFSGEKVTGTFERGGDYLVIKFNKMSSPQGDLDINAYAVNPDSYGFGVADDVDHHYFERFVIPIAANALSAIAQGFTQPLTTISINGSTVATSQSRPTLRDQAISAIGGAGQKAGEIIQQDNASKGPTVWVNSGSPIGIVYISAGPSGAGYSSGAIPNVGTIPNGGTEPFGGGLQ